jgi:hypothetical protein
MAIKIMDLRSQGLKLKPGMEKKMSFGETPYDKIFESEERFGSYYENPEKWNIISKVWRIQDIEDINGSYVFLGKIVERNERDLLEFGNLQKNRTTADEVTKKYGDNTKWLNITLSDSTGTIICTINRKEYRAFGKDVMEKGQDKYLLIKGDIRGNFRKIHVRHIRKIGDEWGE